ncbi:RNA polymerase sigma factor SigJ [Nocardiopsis sp. N85]|uniref:RNA polymerase sigma factor SigJ n=1 Tax=Nocardiopsis sp. N85 TaxID=3029400 RepID=UPI00237F53C0|nr:RNA polymerase sigma factor SigJ [Nocardiopsis sp. N85]MDE3722968.1 RNA polymerase sigma factor SigJ [Nocardiopsis sp. N85]
MNTNDFLAERFERHRPLLESVAYRMLGSLSEAADAVQEAWLRLSRSDADEIDNLPGWLTTVVGRVCLDMLRQRTARREEPVGEHLPDPVVSHHEGSGPEQQAVLADSVGLALLVVLETLNPAERLAFVLHDMFALPFEEIAPIVGRTPAATRQLASRARRRVQGASTVAAPDLARQREVVDAFLAAARGGDFDALLAVLDPDVITRVDLGAARGGVPAVVRGAEVVARQAITYARLAQSSHPALVNGAAGVVATRDGRPYSVMSFTIIDDRIVEIQSLADPVRLARLDLSAFEG